MKGVALAAVLGAVLAAAAPTPGGDDPIWRVDPRFDELVPPGAKLEAVARGFAWVEGPVWDARSGSLLFSDVVRNRVFRWREGEGPRIVLRRSGYSGQAPFAGREPGSNGLAFDSEGRLVLCQHGDRRLARLEADGSLHPLVERYAGKRLNSPNDLLFARGGDLYFTDPPFGLPRAFDDPARELAWSGVYRLRPSGELTLLVDELRAPNGLALAPGERTLYVSNSDPERPVWMAYSLGEDGSVSRGRLFFDAGEWARRWPGLPDGMKVDPAGHLFAAGPGGIHVFDAAGRHLGSVLTGVATSNLAFGPDGRDLYITAGATLYRLRRPLRAQAGGAR